MDIEKLLLAYLISQGAHTAGHFYQAQNSGNPLRDVPIKLDAKNLAEQWDVPDKWSAPHRGGDPYAGLRMSHEDYIADNNRKTTDIRGHGFAMQDRIRETIDDPETKKNVATMGALIKGLYLAGVPMMLSKQINSGGDIEGMEQSSGNKYVKHLVGASALADVYGLPVQFTTVDGAPGLMYTKRF